MGMKTEDLITRSECKEPLHVIRKFWEGNLALKEENYFFI